MLADEELDISEEEKMVGDAGAAPEVFSWSEEEEESDPCQVPDCLLSVRATLVGGVKGLE